MEPVDWASDVPELSSLISEWVTVVSTWDKDGRERVSETFGQRHGVTLWKIFVKP